MSDSGAPSKNSPRRRSLAERVVAWIAIICLLIVVGLELQARVYSNRAATALKSRVSPLSDRPRLTAEEAERQVRGLYSKTDGRSNGRQNIVYRWWSIYWTYALEINLSDDNCVTSINTNLQTIRFDLLQSPSTPGSRSSIDELLSTRGLAEDDPHTLSLSTTDVKSGSRHREDPNDVEMAVFHGALVREIVRQAFLISGETNLQLKSRDQSLGAVIDASDQPIAFPWSVATRVHGDGSLEVEVSRPMKGGSTLRVVFGPFQLVRGRLHESLLECVERLTRKEFADVIRRGGQEGTALHFERSGAVEPQSLVLLDRMDEFSQVAAIRRIHAQIQQQGESPQRLGALIRGYANLGNMTEPHWLLHHKVLKARALNYAQRLVVMTDSSSWALAHRAYAWIMAGRTSGATPDLEALARLPASQAAEVPSWVAALRAYGDYQPEMLDDASQDAPLKAYLKVLLANPELDLKGTLSVSEAALKLAPASARAADLLCQIPALGIARQLAEGKLEQAWPVQYEALSAIPALPTECQVISARQSSGDGSVDELVDRIRLMRLLEEAPDGQLGLPLAFSARLIREISFRNAVHAVRVRKWMLGAPADDVIASHEIAIEGHPLATFLKAFGESDVQLAGQLMIDQMATVPPYELDSNAVQVMQLAPPFDNPTVIIQLSRLVGFHQDLLDRDLCLVLEQEKRTKQPSPDVIARLERASPHLPHTVAVIIRSRKDLPEQQIVEWESHYQRDVGVLAELANWHEANGRLADAERVLKQWVEQSSDHAALYRLANNYQKRGDRDKWLETLNRCLQLPSAGLEHARVHVDIAYDLMHRGQWQQALPHAEEAAASGAGWAYECAADCYEGLGDFEKAESMKMAESHQYEINALNWYFWCERTGHGHLDAAHRLAEASVPRLRQLHPTQRFPVGVYLQINGDFDGALEIYGSDINTARSSSGLVFAAVLAHSLGQSEIRDRNLSWMIFKRKNNPEAGEFADIIQCRLRFADDPWDEAAFDLCVANYPESWVPDLYYLAGTFLEIEQPELAKQYLLCAATSSYTDDYSVLLANVKLRKSGVEIPSDHSKYCGQLADISNEVDELRSAVANGDDQKAIEVANQILERKPDLIPALIARANSYGRVGKYTEQIADCERVLRRNPRIRQAHHALAMLYAAAEDDSILNSQKALEYARQAAAIQVSPDFQARAALAAAFAAAGMFDEAVEEQYKAVDLASSRDVSEAERRLQMFKDHKPYRRSPRTK